MRYGVTLIALAVCVSADRSAAQGIDRPAIQIPAGFLDLKDVTLSTRSDGTVTATGYTTLANAGAFLLLSSPPATTGRRGIVIGVKPDNWSLAKAIPRLDIPPFNSLTLSNVGLVITDQDVRESSDFLPEEDYDFYRQIYQADDFELVLKPGINLISSIPVDKLDANHPLILITDALGIEKGNILLQGTLGKSLTLIGAPGAGAADVIKDLYLRAELPPMRPPNSPEWFRSGQLAVELTGDPSMRLVGEMVIRMDGEDLKFFLATTVARTSLSLSGGLIADEDGWQQPFGIPWLVLNGVVLRLGITATGSIEPGFAAKMVVGEKDIDVAIALAISPAGVPTNFMAKGESEAGFGLSDIVKLQQQMAAARAAAEQAAGGTVVEMPKLDLTALPDVAFKSVKLQFAPKAFPDLNVERGFAVKGRLWLPMAANGQLTDFAGVDVNVGEDGFWARGDMGAFQLGPLRWDDAKLDLTATREAQHFILKGGAELFGARQDIDVNINREGLNFKTSTRLFDLFTADIACESVFNLRNPSFRIDAVVQNDFGEVVGPIFQDGIVRFAAAGEQVTAAAAATAADLDRLLANAQATVDQLRTGLEANRARARASVEEMRGEVARLRNQMNANLNARSAAWNLFQSTPFRQPGLRASRHAAYLGAHARYVSSAAVFNGANAVLAARQAILDALPPVDQNILLMAADAAAGELRQRLAVARDRLLLLEARFAAIREAVGRGELLVDIQRAEFRGELSAAMGGGAMSWKINGSFIGEPFEISRALDFSNVGAATAQLLQQLLAA